jgi:mRNA interferase MazF
MAFQQRDIVLVHFPFTDLSATKLRPAVILSSSEINNLGDFVCAQITSKFFNEISFFLLEEIMLEKALPRASGIRIHKLFCLNETLIMDKISTVTPTAFLELVRRVEKVVFAL